MPLWNDGDQLYGCGDKRKVVFIRKSIPYQQYGTPCSEECHPNLDKKKQTVRLYSDLNEQHSSPIKSAENGKHERFW